MVYQRSLPPGLEGNMVVLRLTHTEGVLLCPPGARNEDDLIGSGFVR